MLLSTRGGDYELRLGQDVSIGYLSHDADSVQLYFTESFTFAAYTTEASVPITALGVIAPGDARPRGPELGRSLA